MALHYQTEYRLGQRGRVCRSYTGYQAFVAIVIDLVFGLCFELVFSVIALAMQIAVLAVHMAVRILRLYWRVLVGVMTFAVYMATLPFAWIHATIDRFRSADNDKPADADWGQGPARKPDWAFGREL
jgi:hypothetical protein